MLSKKVLKDIQSLGVKKYRSEAGVFIAEGPKALHDLIEEVPENIVGIYAISSWIEKNKNLTLPFVEISEIELERISLLKTPNEVLAVVKQFKYEEPVAIAGLSIYLDGIQDPGNLGTIIRICDWYGIKNLICSPGCADMYNPKVVQSTMASISRVQVWYDENDVWLAKQKADLYAATLSGKSVKEIGAVTNGILLIGNESKGLRHEVLEMAKHHVTIPRVGKAESLNAAVATGIILSHFITTGNV